MKECKKKFQCHGRWHWAMKRDTVFFFKKTKISWLCRRTCQSNEWEISARPACTQGVTSRGASDGKTQQLWQPTGDTLKIYFRRRMWKTTIRTFVPTWQVLFDTHTDFRLIARALAVLGPISKRHQSIICQRALRVCRTRAPLRRNQMYIHSQHSSERFDDDSRPKKRNRDFR